MSSEAGPPTYNPRETYYPLVLPGDFDEVRVKVDRVNTYWWTYYRQPDGRFHLRGDLKGRDVKVTWGTPDGIVVRYFHCIK